MRELTESQLKILESLVTDGEQSYDELSENISFTIDEIGELEKQGLIGVIENKYEIYTDGIDALTVHMVRDCS